MKRMIKQNEKERLQPKKILMDRSVDKISAKNISIHDPFKKQIFREGKTLLEKPFLPPENNFLPTSEKLLTQGRIFYLNANINFLIKRLIYFFYVNCCDKKRN